MKNEILSNQRIVFWSIILGAIVIVAIMFNVSSLHRTQNERATATAITRPTMTADALEFLYQKGIGYINIGRWQEAKTTLESIFEIDPNYKDVQAKLIEVDTKIAEISPTITLMPLTITPKPLIETPGFCQDFDIIQGTGGPVVVGQQVTINSIFTENVHKYRVRVKLNDNCGSYNLKWIFTDYSSWSPDAKFAARVQKDNGIRPYDYNTGQNTKEDLLNLGGYCGTEFELGSHTSFAVTFTVMQNESCNK